MEFILHRGEYSVVADFDQMSKLYENWIYSCHILRKFHYNDISRKDFARIVDLPETDITEDLLEKFNSNNKLLDKLFKQWFMQLEFFEEERTYTRMYSLDTIVLSAKNGTPIGYRYDNLLPIENSVLDRKPEFWQHFYGIICLHGHKTSLKRKSKRKEELTQEKRDKAELLAPLHDYNKFIEFLCPLMEGRLLFWQQYGKRLPQATAEEINSFFNWTNFYRYLLNPTPLIDERVAERHSKEVLQSLQRWLQSYFGLTTPSQWQVIINCLKKSNIPTQSFVEIPSELKDSNYAINVVRCFKTLANLLNIDDTILQPKYNSNISYRLNEKDKQEYETWESTNKNSLFYANELINYFKQQRDTYKFLNIATLKQIFHARFPNPEYPRNRALIEEWFERRLKYEQFLNTEFGAKQIALVIFKSEPQVSYEPLN